MLSISWFHTYFNLVKAQYALEIASFNFTESMNTKFFSNDIYYPPPSICMKILYTVCTCFFITIMDGDIYILNASSFMRLDFLIFIYGVVDITCTWYDFSNNLPINMYGVLNLINNLAGFNFTAFYVTCFLIINMIPYFNVLVCIY